MARTLPSLLTARTLALVLVVASALLAACSGAGRGGDEDASTDDVADRSDDPLQQGLDAHVDGDLDDAENLYRRALEADDQNQYALYNLGLVEQTTGRSAEAEQSYRKALAIDPNLGSALYNLAILRTQAGGADEALQLYQQVVTIEPDNAAAHLNLGLLHTQLGRPHEALRELATAVDLDPELATRLSSADPAVAGGTG